MNDRDKRQKILVEERDAIGVYLQSLLRDVPEADQVEVASEVAPIPSVTQPQQTVREPIVEQPVVTPVVETTVKFEQPVTTPVPVVEPEPIPLAEPSQWEGMPEWAGEPFQALLFRLSGLTMAIPLVELDGILEWPSLLTPLPNRSPWYLGLLDNRGRTVPVIELAQLVIPDSIRLKNAASSAANLSRIILVGDGRWGIACDSVSEVITLNPNEVKWRTSRTKRKWLAGTVVDHMCALLDAQGLVHLLSTGQEEPAE